MSLETCSGSARPHFDHFSGKVTAAARRSVLINIAGTDIMGLRQGEREAMFFLIDGYNLLHAMGVLHGRVGPTGLEKARGRLLGLLRGAYAEQEHDHVTVIFDAAKAPPGADPE